MSQALYEIYRRRVFDLAATLIVKHSEVADAVNKNVLERGFTVQTEPSLENPIAEKTWKYYLNLNGEYHYTDTMMTISIAGPTGPVTANFTKSLIQNDPSLQYEYRYGTLFYKDLLNRYPLQEILINGILNPIDIDVAINARDGDILYAGDYFKAVDKTTGRQWFQIRQRKSRNTYNDLVESNEISILDELEDWIKGFLFRWHNKDYALIDDLYIPSMLGVLYLQLPLVIMNLRLANCKTPKAHSYHVRQYLESHGKLAQYIPLLSKKQALYLYRNIKWIETNIGRQETFNDLVSNLMTESGISLVGYRARHNLANMGPPAVSIETAHLGLEPEVMLVREPINFTITGTGSTRRTVEDVLEKEIPYAKDNNLFLDETEAAIETQFATSMYNNLQTKVIESIAYDDSNRSPYPFADVLMSLWAYYSTFELYTATIYFTFPSTGSRLTITAKNALILFLYTYNKAFNEITLTEIPTIGARLIPRQQTPRVSGLLPVLNTVDSFYPYIDNNILSDETITELIDNVIPEVTYTTTADFYNHAIDIHEQLMRRYFVFVKQEDRIGRSMAENVSTMMYWEEVPCELVSGTVLYEDWLADMGIDFTGMSQTDFATLTLELLSNATGSGPSTNKQLRDLQSALLKIMRQLSSYTVQYVQTINDADVLLEGNHALRISNIQSESNDVQRVQLDVISALEAHMQMLVTEEIGMFGEDIPSFPNVIMYDRVELFDSPVTDIDLDYAFYDRINVGSIGVLEFDQVVQIIGNVLPNDILAAFEYPDP